jgi:hypothetical protein
MGHLLLAGGSVNKIMTEPQPTPPPLTTPKPVLVDSRRVVLFGTALWTLGFVVLLPFYGWLGRHDHRIWLWTCLAGALLGLVGLVLVRKHRGEGRTA